MRAAFDQFAKQLLQAALAPVGHVESEREVAPDAQKIDVWFVPDPSRAEERASMGLLGRMAQEPCLFEAFHEPPDHEAVRDCLRKHYAWHSLQRSEAGVRSPLPTLWLLSAGRLRQRMNDFALLPASGWPEGIYAAPPGYGLHAAIIPELPRTPDTLCLRLLGAGRVLADAARELARLPPDSPLRLQAAPIVVRLRLMAIDDPATREREEFMQATNDLFEEFQQRLIAQGVGEGIARGMERGLKRGIEQGMEQGIQRGMEQGIQRGMEQGIQRGMEQGINRGIEQGRHAERQELLVRLFRLRLGRPLTDVESHTLSERTARLGPERIEQVALTTTAAECADWLSDPGAR